jgi:hypothetical protein
MNRQPPLQRPHRNHIPDLLLHNHHHQKIHLRRRIRHLPHARPPRRPHRKPSMMRRRRPLHLHPPHLPPRVHNQVVLLVVPVRLGHHKPPPRGHHHKPHLRQIPPVLAVTPSTRFRHSPLPFPIGLVPKSCRDGRLRPSGSGAAPLSPYSSPVPPTKMAQSPKACATLFFSIYPEYQIAGGKPEISPTIYQAQNEPLTPKPSQNPS